MCSVPSCALLPSVRGSVRWCSASTATSTQPPFAPGVCGCQPPRRSFSAPPVFRIRVPRSRPTAQRAPMPIQRLPADAPDPDVIEEAQEIGAVLLSLSGDFADLVRYPPRRYGGIIALQVRTRPEAILTIVEKLVVDLRKHPEQEHCAEKLFLVEAHSIRAGRHITIRCYGTWADARFGARRLFCPIRRLAGPGPQSSHRYTKGSTWKSA